MVNHVVSLLPPVRQFKPGINNPELYNMYAINDLQKTIFFKASRTVYIFKGYYAGAALTFSTISTDEMLPTRAECYARGNNLTGALTDLNYLLNNRFKKGAYVAYQNLSQTALLALIKTERRKELFSETYAGWT